MADRIDCPNPDCRASYAVAPELLGRAARCKKCGTRFTLSHDGLAESGREPRAAAEPGGNRLPNPLGRYQIERRLGQGGMGAVYLATDTRLGRRVALKIPTIHEGGEPEIIERFRREALAAARLDHPNIGPIYDFDTIDGVHVLALKYIEGRALDVVLAERGPFPEAEAIALVRTLAGAVGEAHRLGIVHRDLKPSNVMVTPRGEPIVMDFGLARQDDARKLTKTGVPLGTPSYMPPEQFGEDLAAIGPRSDVYSLGVILYELLTGRVPFEGPFHAVVGQVLTRRPRPPSTFRPGLDPRLEQVCARMIAKKPSHRYGSMAEVAAALAEVESARGEPLPESPRPAPKPAMPHTPKPVDSEIASGAPAGGSRRPGLVRVMMGVALVLVLLGFVQWDVVETIWKEAAAAARKRIGADESRAGEPAEAKPEPLANRDDSSKAGRADEVPAAERETTAESSPAVPPSPMPPRRAKKKTAARSPVPGAAAASWVSPSTDMALARIGPGEFLMGTDKGDPDERPAHRVTLDRAFFLGVHEVTQDEYQNIMRTNPSDFCATGYRRDRVKNQDTGQHPVENVTWFDAVGFCNALSLKDKLEPYYRREGDTVTTLGGDGYRLPTEAEWEYACRAGPEGVGTYGFGDNPAKLGAHAWLGGNSGGTTHRVGQKTPNAWGLHDMHGNVWEWCQDWYDKDFYKQGTGNDPLNTRRSSARVLRGGSWSDDTTMLRTANRYRDDPTNRVGYYGFRVARTAP